MKEDQIQILKADSVYDFDNNCYKVPYFYFKEDKTINFPKVSKIEAKNIVELNKNKMNLHFGRDNNEKPIRINSAKNKE